MSEAKQRFTHLALGLEQETNEVVRKVALTALQTVVLATPVDTGHARMNWQAGINSPASKELEGVDPGGGKAIGRARSTINARKPGQTVYLSNLVPYIQRLNEGHSAQAPAGFVEKAVMTAAREVANARVIK